MIIKLKYNNEVVAGMKEINKILQDVAAMNLAISIKNVNEVVGFLRSDEGDLNRNVFTLNGYYKN